jgi:hypothetical protein
MTYHVCSGTKCDWWGRRPERGREARVGYLPPPPPNATTAFPFRVRRGLLTQTRHFGTGFGCSVGNPSIQHRSTQGILPSKLRTCILEVLGSSLCPGKGYHAKCLAQLYACNSLYVSHFDITTGKLVLSKLVE